MKSLQFVSRVLLVEKKRALFVKNEKSNFWSLPGGKWEYEIESIRECALRELFEETGYKGEIISLLWAQEFRKPDKIFFELFWYAKLSKNNTRKQNSQEKHLDMDPDGEIKETKWFSPSDLSKIDVRPLRAKNLEEILKSGPLKPDPFIDTFSIL